MYSEYFRPLLDLASHHYREKSCKRVNYSQSGGERKGVPPKDSIYMVQYTYRAKDGLKQISTITTTYSSYYYTKGQEDIFRPKQKQNKKDRS